EGPAAVDRARGPGPGTGSASRSRGDRAAAGRRRGAVAAVCFKHLPVEFDEQGRARLKGGIPDPYSVAVTRPDVAMTDAEREEQIKRLMARNGHIREINMDPVTRVAGALAVNVTADLENGRYLDARSQATL